MIRCISTAAVSPRPNATALAALASPPGTYQNTDEKTPARKAAPTKTIRIAGA